jgi:hypothetical protein
MHRMTGLQACLFSLTRKGSLYKYGALLASYELPGYITINDLAKGVRPDYVVLNWWQIMYIAIRLHQIARTRI